MYLVTGATGNVGSEVVGQLLAKGQKVRVFTRDAAKVAHWGNRVEVATGDFTRPETFAQALSDVVVGEHQSLPWGFTPEPVAPNWLMTSESADGGGPVGFFGRMPVAVTGRDCRNHASFGTNHGVRH